jgi:hypothetical protein
MERSRAITKASEEAYAEIVVELPASAEKFDRELVDRSVSCIRDILAKTVTRGLDRRLIFAEGVLQQQRWP